MNEGSLPDALAQLQPELLASAHFLCRSDHDAEDLVQTTLEIALRHMDRLREPPAMRAWIHRIQVRESLRMYRRLRHSVDLSGLTDRTSMDHGEADLDIRTAVSHLPARTRAAVVLHYMVGYSVAEVGQVMQISPNTVKTLLQRALTVLRTRLEE